jgi:asparagine synthase (glutamine-hydrolysing)
MVLLNEDSPIALGFTRLAIRALDTGNQPFHFNNGTSVINGELYNQDDISSKLMGGTKPEGDMQVLGQFLGEFGIESIVHADGMFAGFLIDHANNELHLFRDKVGEKPLYYRLTENHIEVMSENTFEQYFVSDQKNDVTRALFGFLPEDTSEVKGIKRVAPGSFITFDLSSLNFHEKKYWEWPSRPTNRRGGVVPHSMTFEENLYKSVESRLAADVPIASFLSGGIDSAVITKVAQDILGYPLPAFTLSFKDSAYDESKLARISAKAIGCDLNLIEIDAKKISLLVPNCIDSMKEPILDSACLSLYALSKEVSQEFKVSLTGDGGDELLQGYSLFDSVSAISLSAKFVGISRLIIQLVLNLSPTSSSQSYLSHRMKLERVDSILKHSDLNPIMLALSPLGGTKLLDYLIEMLEPDFRKSLSARSNHLTSEYLESYYRSEVLPHLYLEKADRMSMAHGLELRAPLLSPRLINYSCRFPHSKVKKSEKKFLLREFAREFLPSEVLSAKKHGFSPPLFEMIRYLEEPKWNLEQIGLSHHALQQNWALASAGGQNAAYAAWAVLVLNEYSEKTIS